MFSMYKIKVEQIENEKTTATNFNTPMKTTNGNKANSKFGKLLDFISYFEVENKKLIPIRICTSPSKISRSGNNTGRSKFDADFKKLIFSKGKIMRSKLVLILILPI